MNNIIFGPIHSRRFGKSLGVDLSPSKKQCNFDCLYCELDPAKSVDTQDVVLSIDEIVSAVKKGLDEHKDIDVLTITANGEPTLYPHLSTLIDRINEIKGETKTLILSNASTISDPKIQEALLKIDTVKLSLDCATPKCIRKIDRMHSGIELKDIKQGMLEFASKSKNPLIIEILVVEGINDKESEIKELNSFLMQLKPTRIDLGTIDRPPAYAIKAVSYERLRELSLLFDPALHINIATRKGALPSPSSYSEDEIIDTLKKRPLTPEDIEILFDDDSKIRLNKLQNDGKVGLISDHGVNFYKISKQMAKNH